MVGPNDHRWRSSAQKMKIKPSEFFARAIWMLTFVPLSLASAFVLHALLDKSVAWLFLPSWLLLSLLLFVLTGYLTMGLRTRRASLADVAAVLRIAIRSTRSDNGAAAANALDAKELLRAISNVPGPVAAETRRLLSDCLTNDGRFDIGRVASIESELSELLVRAEEST